MATTPEHNVVRVRGVAILSHGETKPFAFSRYGVEQDGFVLCYNGTFAAFVNLCPHWNVDLDLGRGEFFDERFDAIICRNHGALFEPHTGRCKAGPCVGAGLERFEVTRDGPDLLVHIPPPLLDLSSRD